MRLWQAAQTGSTILALVLMLTSCGGNSSTSSASSLPSPNATPSPSPTPGNVPSPTPTPIPGNATVLNHVEESPWLTCGNCGNNGATGATAAYFDTLGITAPSQDGSSTQFSIAATVPYTNGYFYQKHTPVSAQINALTYEFDLYVPAGSESLPQGIEFECQQILNGWVYNFSWQALYPG
ncbi:MAG: hypothetical protein JWM08_1918, partial [Candidatus Angelobacter sp.]|nr:hypothetical protein [Candidatus Angelobacter sp.]